MARPVTPARTRALCINENWGLSPVAQQPVSDTMRSVVARTRAAALAEAEQEIRRWADPQAQRAMALLACQDIGGETYRAFRACDSSLIPLMLRYFRVISRADSSPERRLAVVWLLECLIGDSGAWRRGICNQMLMPDL